MNEGEPMMLSNVRATIVAVGLIGAVSGSGVASGSADDSIDNNHPYKNPSGKHATFSTQGAVDLTGAFFQPQGTNGRSCGSCHVAEDAWAINPSTLQRLFDETGGSHPVFNALDANNPTASLATVEARRANYSMLLSKGVFRRGGAPRPASEWELVAVDDPHGYANLTRIVQWRRSMPTSNFPVGSANVNWDSGNTVGADQHAGLLNQATRNVTGAQQGSPAPPAVIAEIVAFEESLFTAQLIIPGVGDLGDDGASGGPEALANMTKEAGRFDLYDAFENHENPRKATIFRGQELFNTAINGSGRRCGSCHSAKNSGTNVNNSLFDVFVSDADVRTPDMPLYTLHRTSSICVGQHDADCERQMTDTGRGNGTGLWADLGRFKVPSLRALAGRAPYFHNGMAATLEEVVRHYENKVGFVFSAEERADLVAFLKAL
jgi:cytochrome c peroxidase